MRTFTFLLSLFIFQGLAAQITITSGDLTYPVSPDTAFYMVAGQILPPQEGSNEEWNYESLSAGSSLFFTYQPADGHPEFPDADFMRHYNPSLGALTIIGSAQYYMQNEAGLFLQGFRTSENSYSLAGVTGNPTDVLVLPESYNFYGTDLPLYVFPITTGSEWSVEYSAITPFELTVDAFALNQTPGTIEQQNFAESTVVGWGQVSLPLQQGSFEALLVKHSRTFTDSFFLAGEPAPQALLNAFSLVQGSSFSIYFYEILIQGLKGPAITINTNADYNMVSSAWYTTMAGDIVSAAIPFSENLLVYPNPAGSFLRIELPKPTDSQWHAEIYDVQGKRHYGKPVNQTGLDHLMIDVEMLPSGQYFFQLRDSAGELRGSGSFLRFE